MPLAFRKGDGLDAMGLDLEEFVDTLNADDGLIDCFHTFPPLALPRSGSKGWWISTSQRALRAPLPQFYYQYRSSFHGSALLL
jgi:hypothetical protein